MRSNAARALASSLTRPPIVLAASDSLSRLASAAAEVAPGCGVARMPLVAFSTSSHNCCMRFTVRGSSKIVPLNCSGYAANTEVTADSKRARIGASVCGGTPGA
jgi:hypothetical protein